MALPQNIIYKLQSGSGRRWLILSIIVEAILMLVVTYNLRGFKNMATQEAMDSAQLGRNIAEGRGYTTRFIRPFSLYLIQEHSQRGHPSEALDPSRIRGEHPDISNPPVYPLVLAGLMKVLPFDFTIAHGTRTFWTINGFFARHQPDFLIALFNQVLFFGVIFLVYLLAKRLFDQKIAWLSAALLLGNELLWRFSMSGLSTILLLLIFVSLVWCLVLLEEELREPRRGAYSVYLLAAGTGFLAGIGALTRYSAGWIILPVLVYVVILGLARQRVVLAPIVLLTFAAVVTPWVVRNYSVCGTPLGTATYALAETSAWFPEHDLQRSLRPDLGQADPVAVLKSKFLAGCRRALQDDLPKLGGGWISAFCLLGLLAPGPRPDARRLQYFLLSCLALLALAQGVGHTQISEDSPQVNTENLLVLVAPLGLVYGAALFFELLGRIQWPFPRGPSVALGVFGVLAGFPVLFTALPFGRVGPVSYPPYSPPYIALAAAGRQPGQLTMSDIPWAMAWYGEAQCAWLTPSPAGFLQINDFNKPVHVLYFSPVTTDSRFRSQFARHKPNDKESWGSLIVEGYYRHQTYRPVAPEGFPLSYWCNRFGKESRAQDLATWSENVIFFANPRAPFASR